jgi:hypothetical protein
LVKHLWDLLPGGRTLNFYTSAFWYINAYLITIVVVTILISVTKNRMIHLSIIIGGFLLGTSYQQVTWMHINGFSMMPWNADTVLITAFYTYLGYLGFSKNLRWLERAAANIPIMILAGLVIFLRIKRKFSFHLSLKSHLMHTSLPVWLAVAAIPVLFSLTVMIIAYYTSKMPFKLGLPFIGRHTLSVMYGHKLFLDLCLMMGVKNLGIRLAVGVLAPIFIHVMIQHLFILTKKEIAQ